MKLSGNEDHTNKVSLYGEVILWIAGIPCCALLVPLINSLSSNEITAGSDALIAVSIGLLSSLIVMWNLLNIIIARLALCSIAPKSIRTCCYKIISRVGTQRARHLVMRRAAAIGLSSVGLLSMSAPAFCTEPSLDASDMSRQLTSSPVPTDLSLHPFPLKLITEEKPSPQSSHPTLRERKTPHGIKHQHTVVAGECLWKIAENTMGKSVSNNKIAALTDQIFQQNQGVIGLDPDIIEAGQELEFTTGDQQ